MSESRRTPNDIRGRLFFEILLEDTGEVEQAEAGDFGQGLQRYRFIKMLHQVRYGLLHRPLLLNKMDILLGAKVPFLLI
ncbi:hypothetical protein [Paenibacillus antibioticophila]|uniref:hypothetical protein n=1 Tax=Paenibacillus antibioticophila TaxID=1274374 RepID=UPI0005C9188E|nr:hypothetical protein [Paenibacillus antibioticophila]